MGLWTLDYGFLTPLDFWSKVRASEARGVCSACDAKVCPAQARSLASRTTMARYTCTSRRGWHRRTPGDRQPPCRFAASARGASAQPAGCIWIAGQATSTIGRRESCQITICTWLLECCDTCVPVSVEWFRHAPRRAAGELCVSSVLQVVEWHSAG